MCKPAFQNIWHSLQKDMANRIFWMYFKISKLRFVCTSIITFFSIRYFLWIVTFEGNSYDARFYFLVKLNYGTAISNEKYKSVWGNSQNNFICQKRKVFLRLERVNSQFFANIFFNLLLNFSFEFLPSTECLKLSNARKWRPFCTQKK